MSLSEDDSPLATACRATARTDFIDALNQLRLARGLSYAKVAARAGKQVLPKSTAHALCTKQFPKREEQLRAFLTGCGEPHDRWVEQWQRLLFSRQEGTRRQSA